MLPDLETARMIAEHSVREIRAEACRSGRTFSGCAFIIENEHHEPLAVIPSMTCSPPGTEPWQLYQPASSEDCWSRATNGRFAARP